MSSTSRLSFVNGKWVEDPNSNFFLPTKVKENLDRVKYIQDRDFDAVILIDGMERVGKSVLAMNCANYLSDTNFGLANYSRGLRDCAKKIKELPDKSVIILDEASLIFNSKSSTSKPVKALLKLMDVVGQKNLIFILCLPSFFDLPKAMAIRRSKFLIRVDVGEDYERAKLLFWGEQAKEWLYKKGKKADDSYTVVSYNWVADFKDPWTPNWYKLYKETIKKDSLKEAIEAAIEADGTKLRNEDQLKDVVYYSIVELEKLGLTHEQIANKLHATKDQIDQWKIRYKEEEDNIDIDM